MQHESFSAADAETPPLALMANVLGRMAPLTAEEQAALNSLPHELRSVQPGERLIEAQRTHAHCHLLVTAFAAKEKFAGSNSRIVAINLPGEIVNGESVLALESDYRAVVVRGGDVACIEAAALRDLIFTFPGIARSLWLTTQAEAAIYREWLLNDARLLRSRIAHLLFETSLRLQRLSMRDGPEPVPPFDAAELARAVGAVSLYVDRELKALEDAGAIRSEGGRITIANEMLLADIGEFDPRYLLTADVRR